MSPLSRGVPGDRGIAAQRESTCPYCDEDIESGDRITERDGWGWVHLACGDALAARRIRRGGTVNVEPPD